MQINALSPVRVAEVWEKRVSDTGQELVLQGNTHISHVYSPDCNLNFKSTNIENSYNLPNLAIITHNQEQYNTNYDAIYDLQKQIQALEHERDDVDVNQIMEETLLNVSKLLGDSKKTFTKEECTEKVEKAKKAAFNRAMILAHQ